MEHNFPEKAAAYKWQGQKSKSAKYTDNDEVVDGNMGKDTQWPVDPDASGMPLTEPFDENARYD